MRHLSVLFVFFVGALPSRTLAARMGAACLSHSDCDDALFCHHPADPGFGRIGICTCSPMNHQGCLRGFETCEYDDAFASGTPHCGLPLGAACTVTAATASLRSESPISTNNCHSTNCHLGVCRCDPLKHLGCKPSQVCLKEETSGTFECVAIEEGSLDIGMTCQVHEQCWTGYCYAGMTGRLCACDTRTNEGCTIPEQCELPSDMNNQVPSCFVPMGAECSSDSDCFSSNCWQNQCQCESRLNTGCDRRFQKCVGDEVIGFECISADAVDPSDNPVDDPADDLANDPLLDDIGDVGTVDRQESSGAVTAFSSSSSSSSWWLVSALLVARFVGRS